MIDYLETLKADGVSVEIYFQWWEPDLKNALSKAKYKGSGACAALSYRWIKRQLSKGVLATPNAPVFKKLSAKELTDIAKDQVTHGKHSQLLFEIKEKGYQPTGYQAVISASDQLICDLIGEGLMDFTNEASSNKNIDDLGWWLEGTVWTLHTLSSSECNKNTVQPAVLQLCRDVLQLCSQAKGRGR